jgi:hypothetical protein
MAKTIMETRLEEAQDKTESDDLLRQAGVEPRGWVSRQGCWLLCQMGHMLVSLGQRLMSLDSVQTLSLEGTGGSS